MARQDGFRFPAQFSLGSVREDNRRWNTFRLLKSRISDVVFTLRERHDVLRHPKGEVKSARGSICENDPRSDDDVFRKWACYNIHDRQFRRSQHNSRFRPWPMGLQKSDPLGQSLVEKLLANVQLQREATVIPIRFERLQQSQHVDGSLSQRTANPGSSFSLLRFVSIS